MYNKDELRGTLYDTAKRLYKEGKITKDEYKGYTGENPIERISRNDRSVNGKKSQQSKVISAKTSIPKPIGKGEKKKSRLATNTKSAEETINQM